MTTHSLEETLALGRRIGRALKEGDVVALLGGLGAGKTALAKGIAAGLGVKDAETAVTSPTFALVHEYEGKKRVYHMDWYRLEEGLKDNDRQLVEECFDSDAVSLVEWAERGTQVLPEERLEVRIQPYKPSASIRTFEIVSPSGVHAALLKELAV